MMNGIDVSKFQGVIDWNKVKASGVDFVIIRAGYGRYTSQKDVKFEENYTGAKAAGLNVGAYWYSYADSIEDVKQEAAACIQVLSGKKFEMPIYFDLEEKAQFQRGKTFCGELVKTFCNALENAGYFAGLYISRSPLQTHIPEDVRTRYALWVAEYNARLNYSGAVGIWQKSDSGRVAGISGDVDLDECYIDYPKIIKNGGFNGFSKGQTAENGNSVNSTEQPTGTAEPTTAEQKTGIVYTIRKGDTLTAIAKRYNTTVSALVKLNGIKNPDLIYAGETIKIP